MSEGDTKQPTKPTGLTVTGKRITRAGIRTTGAGNRTRANTDDPNTKLKKLKKIEEIREFLSSSLKNGTIEKINCKSIDDQILVSLIKNAENKDDPIFKINYDNVNIFTKLQNGLKEEEKLEDLLNKLLENLSEDKIKKINAYKITNKKDLKIFKNLLEEKTDKYDPIFKINYGNGEIFKSLNSETVEKILLNLDDEKAFIINSNNINPEILNKLIKNAKAGDSIFKINYGNGEIFKSLNSETVEKILLNLDDKTIKKIIFSSSSIPFSFFKYLSEDIDNKGKIIEKLKMISYYYNDIFNEKYYILLKSLNDQNINKLLEKLELKQKIFNNLENGKTKEVYFENLSFLIEEVFDFCKVAENYELIKKYFIAEGISFFNQNCLLNNEICQNKLIELIKETTENDESFKKIIDFNYFENSKITSLVFNKLDEENLIKLLKNTTNINENILYKNISDLSIEKAKNKTIKKLYQQLQIKKLIEKEKINISNSSDLIVDNFITILKELDENKAIDIVLSNFFDGEELETVIEKIIEKYPSKLPKFDIGKISESELFSLIKYGKIKNTDIFKKSNSSLIFLKDPIKFNIIQKILKDNSLFLNDVYNFNILEELTILDTGEIKAFAEFYCNCQKPSINFKEETLKEALRKIKIKSLSERVYNEYSKKDSDLLLNSGDQEIYLKNRQENLYLLMLKLKEKLEKRLGRIKDKSTKREAKIIQEINILDGYINNLNDKYRENNFTTKLCEDEEKIKEIIDFITKQYNKEVLRRTILDYNRRIEPFVNKYFNSDEKAEELTKNIEYALGVLFDPDISNISHKMEAQKILKDNLGKIGEKYRNVSKDKIFGDYLMLSSICNANSITELNDALYSLIRIRMVNDYAIYHGENNYNQLKLYKKELGSKNCKPSTSSTLYRGLGSTNYDKIMSNPTEKSGRNKYSFFDMTFSNKNINTNCETENSINIINYGSNAGSFTSFSSDPHISIESYGKTFTVVYSIPKNLQKSYFNIETDQSEIIGFDIPIEYRVFSLIYDTKNNVSDVKFSEKMDFVVFRLKPTENIEVTDEKGNIITYKAGENITIDNKELRKIILKLENKNKLVGFFKNQLTIERVFDRNKILNNEEEQEVYKKLDENEKKFQKTLELEKRLERIVNLSRKPFDEEKKKQKR